jgi:hypothetical protein
LRHLLSKYKLFIIVIACQLVLWELMCFLFLHFYFYPTYSRFFHYDYNDYIANIPASFIERYRAYRTTAIYWFDPELGWETGPNISGENSSGCQGRPWHFSTDAAGSRTLPLPLSGKPLVALFGDSYTFGAEVEDDQTWQYFLAKLSGVPIQNFGVGAYGPDQALLRLEQKLSQGLHTPIVVLGLYSGGISRTLSTFWPFLSPDNGLLLGFKPILQERNGAYQWLPSPLRTLDDLGAFETAFQQAAVHDYWYAENKRKPRNGFPYLVTLFELGYYLTFVFEPQRQLWRRDHVAERRMREIVRRFVVLSEEYDFAPVLMFLPELGELDGYNDGKPPYYQQFVQSLTHQYPGDELRLVDVYQEDFDTYKFSLPGCHPSEYGHQIIAAAVYRRIGERLKSLPR